MSGAIPQIPKYTTHFKKLVSIFGIGLGQKKVKKWTLTTWEFIRKLLDIGQIQIAGKCQVYGGLQASLESWTRIGQFVEIEHYADWQWLGRWPPPCVNINRTSKVSGKTSLTSLGLKTSSQAPSYASLKLCPLTDSLTGVKCRDTSVAKNGVLARSDSCCFYISFE